MVIILNGSDTFSSLRRLRQLRDAFREKYDKAGIGVVMLDGETVSESAVRDALGGGGLFSKKSMIVIDQYVPKKTALKPATMVSILSPLVKGSDRVVVIREVAPGAEEKKKRANRDEAALGSLKIPGAKVESFSLPDVAQNEKWVMGEVKKRGGRISVAAARRLVAATGVNLWRQNNEIDKLLAYAFGREIQEKDVELLVVTKAESDVFKLTDALGGGQKSVALKALHKELATGAHPLAVLAILQRQVRILLEIARLQPENAAAAARELALHPFVAQKSLVQAKKIGRAKLEQWYKQLLVIDREIKSTPLEAETLLDIFLAKD